MTQLNMTRPTPEDPFNCPVCGAHDYGLMPLGKCIHCLERKLAVAVEALKAAKRTHYECGDPFYTCYRHPEYPYDGKGEPCNCGADKHNARIDKALHEIEGYTQKGITADG